MDNVRFDELKHSVEFGGLPSIENETFSKDQKTELEVILKARAQNSLEYIKLIKIE